MSFAPDVPRPETQRIEDRNMVSNDLPTLNVEMGGGNAETVLTRPALMASERSRELEGERIQKNRSTGPTPLR